MPAAGPRPWLFLLVSAAFEVVWIVSLKLTAGFARLGPLLIYAASGLGAAVCLSIAMKKIPMGTAYAVWMGASVVGALLVDVAFFKEPWNVFRAACAFLILLGTCGLRFAASR
jgi:quaternary ammonium compound-resistance protein SugE